MKMKEIVQQLCLLLREGMDVPVFEETLPEGFSIACLVVRQESCDCESRRSEYHINVYVPNKLRVFAGFTDRTYPDTDEIDALGERALSLCEKFRYPFTNTKVHPRKYIRGGGMHYLNICLYGQFSV